MADQYIVVVSYGDPNTHLPLRTSFGLFDSSQDANDWVNKNYQDVNYIVQVLPLNKLVKVLKDGDGDADVIPFKKDNS